MSSVVRTEHVNAELLAFAPQGVEAGAPVLLGLRIQHQPKWHTYWKNPGDSGLPTTFTWDHVDGIVISPIQWPVPKSFLVGPLMNYGYEGEVLLPVSVKIPAGAYAESLDVKLRAKWLVCEEICIPESGDFALKLPAGQPQLEHAALFETARTQVPDPHPQMIATQAQGDTLSFVIGNLPDAMHGHELRFVPATTGVFDYAAPIQQQWKNGVWSASVPISAQRTRSPQIIQAVLVDDTHPGGVEVRLDASSAWPNGAAETIADQSSPPPTPQSWSSIGIGLGFAFVLLAAVVYLLNRSKS